MNKYGCSSEDNDDLNRYHVLTRERRPVSGSELVGGKLPSRVLDSPRRREKVKPVDARGGRKEGEFKQACLIDASVFFSRAGCSVKRFRPTPFLI